MRTVPSSIVLCALCALPSRVLAQTASTTPSPPPTTAVAVDASLVGPITSVRLEPSLPGENSWTRSALAPGTSFTPARAREALRFALASGTFAEARVTVRPVAGGLELVLRGERRFRLQSFALRGVSARSADEVTQDLGLRANSSVTEASVTEALARVDAAYHDAGFPSARARREWRETDEPGTRVLLVEVEEGAPLRIRRVTLEGAPSELEGSLHRALGLSVGSVADPRRVRTAVDAMRLVLRRAGYLAADVSTPAITADPDGALAELRVSVTPRDHYRVTWAGVRSFAIEDLTAALRLDEERNFDGATLGAVQNRARDYYQRRGWLDATVQVATVPDGTNSRALRFVVREGRQVFVRAMLFPGRTVFPASELEVLVRGVLASELPNDPTPYRGRLDRGRVYHPEVYSEVARRIVLRYRERGYLDAEVATPTTDRSADGSLSVTFPVTEGPQTNIDELAFEGNRAEPSATLARVMDLRLGIALSYLAMDEARVRLVEHYRRQGYAFARIEPEVLRSPDRSRARVRVRVHEGPRVRIGAIRIRGNGRTPESVVRARLTLREGGYYMVDEVRVSQRRLAELGIFSGVNISLDDPELEAPLKTMVVQVTERPPQSLELRGGFTTGGGPRVGFEYQHVNVLNRAIAFSLGARVGTLIQIPGLTPEFRDNAQPTLSQLVNWRVTASLGFAYVPFLGYGWGTSVDLSTVRVLQPPLYSLTTNGIGLSITNRALQGLAFTFTGEVQNATTTLFGARNFNELLATFVTECQVANPSESACITGRDNLRAQLQRLYDGSSLLGALRLGAAWDRRDSAFNPTRGFYLGASVEYLHLFSPGEGETELSRHTLHVTGRATGYVPIPLGGMVLAASLRAGQNVQLTRQEATHPSRLFLLGGADSMRGWLQNTMVPQDVADQVTTAGRADASRIFSNSGEFFWNAVVDLRIPTGLCATAGVCFALGVFCDFGNLWSDLRKVDLTRVRFSPGLGLRTTSPFGIIALDVGFNPLYREQLNEQSWAVQFSLGSV